MRNLVTLWEARYEIGLGVPRPRSWRGHGITGAGAGLCAPHTKDQAGPALCLFLLLPLPLYFSGFYFRYSRKFGNVERKAQTVPSVFMKSPSALNLFMERACLDIPLHHPHGPNSCLWMHLKTCPRGMGAFVWHPQPTACFDSLRDFTNDFRRTPHGRSVMWLGVELTFSESERNMHLATIPGLPGAPEFSRRH